MLAAARTNCPNRSKNQQLQQAILKLTIFEMKMANTYVGSKYEGLKDRRVDPGRFCPPPPPPEPSDRGEKGGDVSAASFPFLFISFALASFRSGRFLPRRHVSVMRPTSARPPPTPLPACHPDLCSAPVCPPALPEYRAELISPSGAGVRGPRGGAGPAHSPSLAEQGLGLCDRCQGDWPSPCNSTHTHTSARARTRTQNLLAP